MKAPMLGTLHWPSKMLARLGFTRYLRWERWWHFIRVPGAKIDARRSGARSQMNADQELALARWEDDGGRAPRIAQLSS